MPVRTYRATPQPANAQARESANLAKMESPDANNKKGNAYNRLKVAALPRKVTSIGP